MIGKFMDIPQGTKTALIGAAVGAVAVAAIGFIALGWTTAGTAQRNADEASSSAVAAIMTPYCVARAKEPESAAVLAEIKGSKSFSAQRGMLEKAGWATPIGTMEPIPSVADACLRTISAGL
jgi:hypothetical protein